MEDHEIVGLYWSRSEEAIRKTETKYGRYCQAIARRILTDEEDAREAVNDAYLAAWNSMPPHRPAVLSAYLGKLTRRISINRRAEKRTGKRGGGEVPLALDELSDCLSAGNDVEQAVEAARLSALMAEFVRALPETERRVFVCRYWHLYPIADLAKKFGFSQSKVKSMLARTRKKLRTKLEQEGILYETH